MRHPDNDIVVRLAIVVGIAASTSACLPSPQSAEVAGSVTVDGQPLDEGIVTFRPQPTTPGPEFSGEVRQGAYRVAIRVLPGGYAVHIRSWKKSGKKVTSPFGVEVEETVPWIPDRYCGPQTTLSATLAPGLNRADFTLETR
jgi:hypothetical protein